jgi:hypoxanthine phosphoribosyltransferase
MQYLEEVVKGIKSLQVWEKVVEHKVGLALETLSHWQQSAVTALQWLYMEVQQSGELSNDWVAQCWNDLEKRYDQVEDHLRMQEQRRAESLWLEGEWTLVVEGEIVGEVNHIRNDKQEFVNKQLPG